MQILLRQLTDQNDKRGGEVRAPEVKTAGGGARMP